MSHLPLPGLRHVGVEHRHTSHSAGVSKVGQSFGFQEAINHQMFVESSHGDRAVKAFAWPELVAWLVGWPIPHPGKRLPLSRPSSSSDGRSADRAQNPEAVLRPPCSQGHRLSFARHVAGTHTATWPSLKHRHPGPLPTAPAATFVARR
jgi:hypothetical protein